MVKIKGIILVEPKKPGNMGAVARSMKAFGVNELIVVCKEEYNEKFLLKAKKASMQGKDIIENVKFVKNLNEIAGKKIATVSKLDSLKYKEKIKLIKITELKDIDGEFYLVFGRENKGLSEEEIKSCNICSTIPAKGKYCVLNLAVAVSIYLYELTKEEW